jgi:hypothetical protein
MSTITQCGTTVDYIVRTSESSPGWKDTNTPHCNLIVHFRLLSLPRLGDGRFRVSPRVMSCWISQNNNNNNNNRTSRNVRITRADSGSKPKKQQHSVRDWAHVCHTQETTTQCEGLSSRVSQARNNNTVWGTELTCVTRYTVPLPGLVSIARQIAYEEFDDNVILKKTSINFTVTKTATDISTASPNMDALSFVSQRKQVRPLESVVYRNKRRPHATPCYGAP